MRVLSLYPAHPLGQDSKTLLKFREILSYSVGQLGLTAVDLCLRIYLLKFYVDVLRLPPLWAGVAAAIALIWDAITDPWMGKISDQVGRRLWFPLGGTLGAVIFLLLFWGWRPDSEALLFVLLLLNYLALNTCFTIFDIPYHALGGELSEDSTVRSKLFAWRYAFSNIGSFLPLLLPIVFSHLPEILRYRALGISVSLILLVTSLVTYFGTRERQIFRPGTFQLAFNPLQGIEAVLRNKIFLGLLACQVLSMVGLAINSSIALFYYEYRLRLSSVDTQWIIFVFMLVFTLGLGLWVWLAKRFEKKTLLFWGVSALGLSGAIVYPLFEPGQVTPPFVYAIVAGVFAGSIVLLDSWLVEILEYDEARFGGHRMGLFFGFWRFAAKLTRAAAILLTGVILDVIGFVPKEVQSESSSTALAWFFGPGVNLFFVLAAVLAFFIPFESKHYLRSKSLLHRRRRKTALQEVNGD